MKKTLAIVMGALVVFGAFALPATAAKRATKTTFYLHGQQQVGEAQFDETWLNSNFMKMDTTEPAAGAPKSMFVTNYFRGPNTACSGNGLLPVWRGDLSGKVKGDVVVTLHTVATPAVKLTADLYGDGTGTCGSTIPGQESEAPTPTATTQVDVAPGHAETVITFKGVNFKTAASLVLQLSIPSSTTPGQVRVLYDSADFASNVVLSVR